MTTTAVSN